MDNTIDNINNNNEDMRIKVDTEILEDIRDVLLGYSYQLIRIELIKILDDSKDKTKEELVRII